MLETIQRSPSLNIYCLCNLKDVSFLSHCLCFHISKMKTWIQWSLKPFWPEVSESVWTKHALPRLLSLFHSNINGKEVVTFWMTSRLHVLFCKSGKGGDSPKARQKKLMLTLGGCLSNFDPAKTKEEQFFSNTQVILSLRRSLSLWSILWKIIASSLNYRSVKVSHSFKNIIWAKLKVCSKTFGIHGPVKISP